MLECTYLCMYVCIYTTLAARHQEIDMSKIEEFHL